MLNAIILHNLHNTRTWNIYIFQKWKEKGCEILYFEFIPSIFLHVSLNDEGSHKWFTNFEVTIKEMCKLKWTILLREY